MTESSWWGLFPTNHLINETTNTQSTTLSGGFSLLTEPVNAPLSSSRMCGNILCGASKSPAEGPFYEPCYYNSNNCWCSETKHPSCYNEETVFLRTITNGVIKVYLYLVLG